MPRFNYSRTRTGSGIRIDKYTGSATAVNIPAQIDGLPVTSIGYSGYSVFSDYRAFSGCSSLTTITIPDSVTSIGDYAFSHCSSLEFIKIPDSVNRIGRNLFEGCDHLKWVYKKKSREDEIINNIIFGDNPHHKIFRTIREVKQYLKETLSELIIIGFSLFEEVLENSLRSRNTSDDMIMDIVAPAINDLEDLEELQHRKFYFGRVINLINAVSSVELTGTRNFLEKLNQEESFIESDLKTNIVALLMLENKLFTKNMLPNPDLSVVKEAAQVLSRLEIRV